jgi:hypothetical protein
VALGAVACGLGIPSVTHWYERPGFTGFGIAGNFLGSVAVSVGFAYQIKHSAGALDWLYIPLAVPGAYGVLGLSAVCFAIGLVVARKVSRPLGVVIAAVSIAVLAVAAGWALTTADRALLAEISRSFASSR